MQRFKKLRIQDYGGDLSKRWYVQYLFQNPDTLKFEVHRTFVSSVHKTKSDRFIAAKTLLDAIEKKLIAGYNPYSQEQQITLRQALEHIVEVKRKTQRARTWLTYKNITVQFCNWLERTGYQNIMPDKVSKQMAQAYFDHIIIDGKKLSARTYNNHLRALRSLFNELVARDVIDYNVFTKIKVLELTEPDAIAYSVKEMKVVRDHLEYSFPELWLCALFVHYSFIRPQELCRLQFHDLNFENQTIQVPGNKSKNKRTQTVLMPDPLYNKLIEMAYHTMPGDLYIFSKNSQLRPGYVEISPTRIFNQWQKHVQEPLQMKKGIYLFKHTGVGLLFDSGADDRSIQLQLRHHSIDEAIAYAKKFSQLPNKKLLTHFKPI